MTSHKPLSEGRKKKTKNVNNPPWGEPALGLHWASSVLFIYNFSWHWGHPSLCSSLHGALHYLASLAWGRAWELAWLLWWWSPQACQSNQTNRSLQERRDCYTPVCGDSTRLLAHTPLCGCCAMVLHHCQGLPHQAGAGKGIQPLCCSVVTYHKSFRKAWPLFQSPHPSCGCCPAPAIPN